MSLDRFRAYLTREAAVRVLASLALALILWALVTIRQDPETDRVFAEVPVQALALDTSLVMLNQVEPVQVEISGPQSDVEPIEANGLIASVDLSSVIEPGTYELPITLVVPDGVWRSTVSPATATVEVEQSESKSLRVDPVVKDLDENSLRTVSVNPDEETATVSGPSSLVESVVQVILPVEVSGGTQTFEEVFIPQAVDKDGAVVMGVTVEPAAVQATVRVSARGKSVAVLASISGSPAPGYEVAERTIIPQFVVVDGDEAVLDSLVALMTEPIDVTGMETSFSRSVGIADLPDGLQILQPSSGQVEVLVQITQRGVRQSLPSQQVTVVGLETGLTAVVSPDEITIEVVASEGALAELDSSTLQVIVDATGLAPGTYSVQPSVIMPPHMQWVATVPSEVTLTISAVSEQDLLPSAPFAGTAESAP